MQLPKPVEFVCIKMEAISVQDDEGNALETEFGLSTYRDHQTFSIQVWHFCLILLLLLTLFIQYAVYAVQTSDVILSSNFRTLVLKFEFDLVTFGIRILDWNLSTNFT